MVAFLRKLSKAFAMVDEPVKVELDSETVANERVLSVSNSELEDVKFISVDNQDDR